MSGTTSAAASYAILQDRMKRDPHGYRGEFSKFLKHFVATCVLWIGLVS